MEITEKYISTSAKATEPASKKIVLGDDAYAICEFLETLTKIMWASRTK